jgi:hypothetical protein
MKRYLGVIVGLVCLVIAGIAISGKVQAKNTEDEKELSFARIQHTYLERAGWIRSNPDEKSYKEEVTTFLRSYFKDVDQHLAQYKLNKNHDDYLQELNKRAAAPSAKDQEIADRKAYYEYTKKHFDLLKSGSYAPLFSATDKGMRLDVVSAEVKQVMGKPQVVVGILLWGAQRELREEGRTGSAVRKMMTSAAFNVTWKLFTDKDALHAEMNAPGDPHMKIDWPERFIAEFPPQMVLGFYPFDLLPAEAAKMEILFNVNSRSASGGEAVAAYSWKMDVPAEWKLKPGEKWEGAEDSVRPEDEIRAKTAEKQAP